MNWSVGVRQFTIIWRKAMEGKVAPLGSSPTFSDSSSYVGLTLTNKQSVCGSPHRAQSMGIGRMGM